MFKVKLASSTGFNEAQQKTMESSLKKFETVMNSDELKRKILEFTSPAGSQFEDNLGLNNQQVFEKLYAGEEFYTAGVDYTADLHLVLVKKSKPLFQRYPAIGYGNPGQKEIYTYSRWFRSAKDYEYAGHITHEWSHKVGFDHSFRPTASRDFSVNESYILYDLYKRLETADPLYGILMELTIMQLEFIQGHSEIAMPQCYLMIH
jgi:hypothetical protein